MPIQNIVLGVVFSLGLIIITFELVRRRKLNEEYSWLWMCTGAVLFLLSVFPGLLLRLTRALGLIAPASALFFFGVFFLLLIVLHFSAVISRLTNRQKELAQRIALLERELEAVKEERK
ncbi:MAG: DUF2304 domain-containing protein [Elusimicrobia bacterium]|nr:DUF2304 domain-containing protein [Elusimicrobiota bacterium]